MSTHNGERRRSERETGEELVGIDSRPLRDIGNCIGFSFDRNDLERAGVIDEDGTIPEETSVSYRLYNDGRLVAEIGE